MTTSPSMIQIQQSRLMLRQSVKALQQVEAALEKPDLHPQARRHLEVAKEKFSRSVDLCRSALAKRMKAAAERADVLKAN